MQEKLLPDDKPNLDLREVPLHQLPLNEDLHGPGPERSLVDSIERWGLLEPIIIYGEDPDPNAYPEGRYKVHSGRRRIKAHRVLFAEWAHANNNEEVEENPYRKIKAFWADTQESAAAFINLTEQATRRPNVAADVEAIEELIRQGLDEKQIAASVGMSVGTVKARIKLAQSLAPKLMEGLKAGKIKPSVAEAAAKLGRTAQSRLEAVYAREGKLTGPDVEEERRRRVESASKQVEFDMPGMDELGIPQDAAPEMPTNAPGREVRVDSEAAAYLRDRLREIRAKDQAKWTKKDMDILEALLTNL